METRPWGTYEVLCDNSSTENYLVKEIIVHPGKRLSLQTHQHRSEHWIVIKGSGKAVVGEDTILLGVNTSVFIPKAVKHRLCNTSETENLVIIEVQFGSILDENDIERFQDDFNR